MLDYLKPRLSKEICVRCCNNGGIKWNERDEERWKYGEVLCTDALKSIFKPNVQKIWKKPHNFCPYFLEHTVMENTDG